MNSDLVTISIVSHRQAELARLLLNDIAALDMKVSSVVLTLNVPEPIPFHDADFDFPLRIIRNGRSRGFGANHNAAFRDCATPYFCVLNPDIRLPENPFPRLVGELSRAGVGVVAPLIVDMSGAHEDSARKFPTCGSLLRKVATKQKRLDYVMSDEAISPDWIAGMFMLFRSEAFRRANGFDERYFLYYEDVDLCRRLREMGADIRVVPSVRAVHAARRRSRSDLRHMGWHLRSMLRFLSSR